MDICSTVCIFCSRLVVNISIFLVFKSYLAVVFCYTQMGDDTNPNSVIEEIMETPEKLRDLDLDAFAEELERQVCTHIILTSIVFLRKEFTCVRMYVIV